LVRADRRCWTARHPVCRLGVCRLPLCRSVEGLSAPVGALAAKALSAPAGDRAWGLAYQCPPNRPTTGGAQEADEPSSLRTDPASRPTAAAPHPPAQRPLAGEEDGLGGGVSGLGIRQLGLGRVRL